jgi:hypothetical protein
VRFLKVKSQILKYKEWKCILSIIVSVITKFRRNKLNVNKFMRASTAECKAKADTEDSLACDSGRESCRYNVS